MSELEIRNEHVAALGRGWKFLLFAWLLSILTVFTFGILDGLYKHASFVPIPFWSFWVFVLVVAVLFLIAMVIALKSMVRKQGGLALFLITVVVSIAGFLSAFPVMMILSVLVSGDRL